MRDPRNWYRPAAAVVVGGTAAGALVLVRARQQRKQAGRPARACGARPAAWRRTCAGAWAARPRVRRSSAAAWPASLAKASRPATAISTCSTLSSVLTGTSPAIASPSPTMKPRTATAK